MDPTSTLRPAVHHFHRHQAHLSPPANPPQSPLHPHPSLCAHSPCPRRCLMCSQVLAMCGWFNFILSDTFFVILRIGCSVALEPAGRRGQAPASGEWLLSRTLQYKSYKYACSSSLHTTAMCASLPRTARHMLLRAMSHLPKPIQHWRPPQRVC